MKHLVTLVMAGALLLLAFASLAPVIGLSGFTETRYVSEGLGRTGYILLTITLIGGLVYWAGRNR